MSYQITNTGASIRFVSNDAFFFLMKQHIKSIRFVRDNFIRIDTGCCLHSIYIQATEVTEPFINGAEHLAQVLNDWTTSFPQINIDPGPVEK